jgi:two-component system cell cycle sensor histidine kinase/response regulator CckA
MSHLEGWPTTADSVAAAHGTRRPEQAWRGPDIERAKVIGRVAGRIAHDFNNLLMVIRSESELAALDLEESHPAHEALENVRHAVDRATALTSRLLVLNYMRGPADESVTDLNDLVAGVRELPTEVASGRIAFEKDCVSGPLLVRSRADKLATVLRELLANACEAMPSGGRLRVATSAADVGESRAAIHATEPGSFGVLSVADTGEGISAEVLGRLFEPFATTKGTSEHPGLGLATSLAVVGRAGGWIEIQRGPGGEGTTVLVYLPRANDDSTERVPAT